MEKMHNILILSNGQESTVRNWITLTSAVFGEDSEQVKFLKSKASIEKGLDEPILVDERKMIYLLVNLPNDWNKKEKKEYANKFYGKAAFDMEHKYVANSCEAISMDTD